MSNPTSPNRSSIISPTSPTASTSSSFTEGDRVLISNVHLGFIRYIGRTKFSNGDWIGVELDKPVGNHDGVVQGYRYFTCRRKNCGMFVRPADVVKYNAAELNSPTHHNLSSDNTNASFNHTIGSDSEHNFDLEISNITERLAASKALEEMKQLNNSNSAVQEEEYIDEDGNKVRNITKTTKTTYTTHINSPPSSQSKIPNISTSTKKSSSSSSSNTNSSVPKSKFLSRIPTARQNTSNSNIQNSPQLIKNLDQMLERRSSIAELQKAGVMPMNPVSSKSINVSGMKSDEKSSVPVKSFGAESSTRRIWVWGENQHGELSTGNEQDVRIPSEISHLFQRAGRELAQFSLGLHHTVALSMTNDVYTAGSWISGLLGSDDRMDIHKLKKLKQFAMLKKQHPLNPIVCVSCGDRHSVALHASGDLYTWGGTLYGKLGRSGGDSGNSNGNYLLVTALQGKRVVNVSCGNVHTAVCTDEGEVYTFGGGGKFYNSGQLGTSDRVDSMIPRKIEKFGSNIFIRDIVCGGYHSLALSASRQVYSWGRGEFGQLGLGTDTNELEPRLIETLSSIGRCLTLAAGENHSLCCMESGELYSFGYAMQGQLGHGSMQMGLNGNERLPKKIKWFSERNIAIVQVAAGWRHSIALTLEQQVYTWGHGDRGQLGHGDTKSTSLPKLVESLIGEDVRQVGAGGSHSLAFNAYFKAAQEMVYIEKVRRAEQEAKKQAKQQEVDLKNKQKQHKLDKEKEIQQGRDFWNQQQNSEIPLQSYDENPAIYEEQDTEQTEESIQNINEEEQYEERPQPHDFIEQQADDSLYEEEETQPQTQPESPLEKHQQQAQAKAAPAAAAAAAAAAAVETIVNNRPSNEPAPSGLSVEIVYSAQIQFIHRFITFQTRHPPREFESVITRYVESQYNQDSGMIIDNFIISQGNIMPRYTLPQFSQYNDNNDNNNNHPDLINHLEHIYEYYPSGPPRYTVMLITTSVDSLNHENLWPSWCHEFYQRIKSVCKDIHNYEIQQQQAKQKGLNPVNNDGNVILGPAFKELRPEHLKSQFSLAQFQSPASTQNKNIQVTNRFSNNTTLNTASTSSNNVNNHYSQFSNNNNISPNANAEYY